MTIVIDTIKEKKKERKKLHMIVVIVKELRLENA